MAALHKMNNVWIRNDRVKQSSKLKLYRSLVKPILMYNSGTWSPTLKEFDDLDGFHRKRLRLVLNVKHPVKMKSKTVYRITEEEILSTDFLRNRWKLFGHVRRMHEEETPAFKSIVHLFSKSSAPKFRGRPRINMPQKLNHDLEKYCLEPLLLKSFEDLERLKTIAQDRRRWIELVCVMCVAARAAKNI